MAGYCHGMRWDRMGNTVGYAADNIIYTGEKMDVYVYIAQYCGLGFVAKSGILTIFGPSNNGAYDVLNRGLGSCIN